MAYTQREPNAVGDLMGHARNLRGQAAMLGALLGSALSGKPPDSHLTLVLCCQGC